MKKSDNELILEYLIDISGNKDLKIKEYKTSDLFIVREFIKADERFKRYRIVQNINESLLFTYSIKFKTNVIIHTRTSDTILICLMSVLTWAINYILYVYPKEQLEIEKEESKQLLKAF